MYGQLIAVDEGTGTPLVATRRFQHYLPLIFHRRSRYSAAIFQTGESQSVDCRLQNVISLIVDSIGDVGRMP